MVRSSDARPPAYPQAQERLRQVIRHFDAQPASRKLSGKICILTGVGHPQGIGWASAIQFAKEDAQQLYLLDLSAETLPRLSSSITQMNPGTKVTTFAGDACDEQLIKKICNQALEQHGHLDVFFANAGIATLAPIEASDIESARQTLENNSLSCWLALKYASEAMLKNCSRCEGGSIILTASVAGLRFGAGSVDYSASKAAVISMAMTGANAHFHSGIRVNAICPGIIETNMTATLFDTVSDKSKIGQLCALGRYGLPVEVAALVLFLASNDSSYLNGAVIPIDGGLSSSLPVAPGRKY